MTRKITAAVAATLCAVAIGACGDDDESGSESASAEGVEVTDVWSRVTAPSQTAGAVYMTIRSEEGDKLVKASAPTSIAGKTELHETTTEGGMDHGSTTAMSDDAMSGGAAMSMKPVASVDIPAGGETQLKPGGYHVMMLELADPITEGETIPVTLEFEKAGTVEVEATARKS